MKIGFIGLGNMAKAMIGGMLQKEIVQTGDIFGSARSRETLEAVRAGYGIGTRDSNVAVAGEADVLILAVKPQFFQTVIEEIREVTPEKTLVISIAAGKTMDWIEQAFGRKIKLVRCMPNTPALVGAGCTGVCVNGSVSAEETAFSLRLMESFGRASLVPESLMDAVGAVSGSSPAYVFMFIEAMADAAECRGDRRMSLQPRLSTVRRSSCLRAGSIRGSLKIWYVLRAVRRFRGYGYWRKKECAAP